MTTLQDQSVATSRDHKPFIIVSSDSHVGPSPEHLTQYCPAKYRSRWEDWAKEAEAYRRAQGKASPIGKMDVKSRWTRNLRTDGHWEPHARVRDMDFEGIAAEVVFHGSQNGQHFPFRLPGRDPEETMDQFGSMAPRDPELAAVGIRMYNRYVADFVSVAPERFAALCYVPTWDVEASVAELEWGAEHGLKGVNFPTVQSYMPEYNKPVWDRFWAAAQDHGMPLTTHVAIGSDVTDYSGVNGWLIEGVEAIVLSRRSIIFLVLAGVFERYPNLKLVITEVPGFNWGELATLLDSMWRGWGPEVLGDTLPEAPSTYMRRSVFVGGSHASRLDVDNAIAAGFGSQFLWGSDYPHTEGTFQRPESPADEPNTRLALRWAFAGRDLDTVEDMLGRTACGVYGFDDQRLADIASQISAPTWADVNQPVDDAEIPEGAGQLYNLAFRRNGPFD